MDPTYIDNIFSFLSQIVFSNVNLKKGILQVKFLPKKDPKSKKKFKNEFLLENSSIGRFLL
jgi:hypothetical protein